eukprot:GFYU01006820.1.p1 GENE.GFYU01006820.1~~GFYU01006820.1.p1  ORF type:complete len:580 (-),score=77.10 GFYU01006820.1:425-2164(-)
MSTSYPSNTQPPNVEQDQLSELFNTTQIVGGHPDIVYPDYTLNNPSHSPLSGHPGTYNSSSPSDSGDSRGSPGTGTDPSTSPPSSKRTLEKAPGYGEHEYGSFSYTLPHPQPQQNATATRVRKIKVLPGWEHDRGNKQKACIACSSLKKKCEWLPENRVCVRCHRKGTACVTLEDGRKKRRPPPRESVTQSAKAKQAVLAPTRDNDVFVSSTRHVYMDSFERVANSILGFLPKTFLLRLRQGRVLEEGVLAAALAHGIRSTASAIGSPQEVAMLKQAITISERNHAMGSGVTVEHGVLCMLICSFHPLDCGKQQQIGYGFAQRTYEYMKEMWLNEPDTTDWIQSERLRNIFSTMLIGAFYLCQSSHYVDLFFVQEVLKLVAMQDGPDLPRLRVHASMFLGAMAEGRLTPHKRLALSLAQIPAQFIEDLQVTPLDVESAVDDLSPEDEASVESAIDFGIESSIAFDAVCALNSMCLKTIFLHKARRFVEFGEAMDAFHDMWMAQGTTYAMTNGFVLRGRLTVLGALAYLNGDGPRLHKLLCLIRLCGGKTITEQKICEIWMQRLGLSVNDNVAASESPVC